MKYQYNYSFLEKWIKANDDIPVGVILQALGSKTNSRLKAWARKESPVPVISMLRFCNAFQVPISAFFCDEEAGDNLTFVPGKPTMSDQLEPDGGYADLDCRQKGERTLISPTDVSIVTSVIPEAERYIGVEGSDNGSTIEHDKTEYVSVRTLLEIESRHEAAERRNDEQRGKLLDIIAEQQKQIADLTRLLNTRADSLGIHGGYMVADHPERD